MQIFQLLISVMYPFAPMKICSEGLRDAPAYMGVGEDWGSG